MPVDLSTDNPASIRGHVEVFVVILTTVDFGRLIADADASVRRERHRTCRASRRWTPAFRPHAARRSESAAV